MLRSALRKELLARSRARAHRLDPADFTGTTLVLAPHPDDETLGSGGLIALLRDRELPVEIAFATDGAGSHPSLARDDLAAARQVEAAQAAAVLGVGPDRLHFLDFPDGGLAASREAAVTRVAALLDDVRPSSVVLPHPDEPNRDHAAAHDVTAAAVSMVGRSVQALTYIVWFWDQWPWTNPLSAPRGRHGRRQILDTARRGRLGFGVTDRLTHVVDVTAVLDRKRAALAMHRSQMTRPDDQPDWLTLPDVANGDWLDLLLQPFEPYALGVLEP